MILHFQFWELLTGKQKWKVSQPIVIEYVYLFILRIKQKGSKVVNRSRYQRSRGLRAKVIISSEQIIEKLDKLLLLVIIPLSFAAIVNAFLQLLFWFIRYLQAKINPKGK